MHIDVIKWIKGWRLDKFFENIFHKAEGIVKDIIPMAIEVVNNIKNFDTSNPKVLDVLTAIIPGTWDDALKNKLRDAIPKVLSELKIVKDKLETDDPNAFIKAAIDELNKLLPEIKGLFLHNIAILITDALADGKLSIPEITGIMQAVYEEINKTKNETPKP